MQQTIQQTTDYYLSTLPDDKEYYYPRDFELAGFPSFLVNRLQGILFQKLVQTVKRPETKWADTEDQAVCNRWQKFTESLQNNGRIPADNLEQVIKEAVSDVIRTLLQPGEQISKILFEERSALTKTELNNRVGRLVVYPYWGQVLTRYMQRKGKDELSRKKCDEIISRAGEKITQNYSPEQWTEMLHPLFELINSPVKADLFHLFFEDQGMEKEAQIFENLDSKLTRDEFTEVLAQGSMQENDEYDVNSEKPVGPGNGLAEVEREVADQNFQSSQEGIENDAQEVTVPEVKTVDENQPFSDETNSGHAEETAQAIDNGSTEEQQNQTDETNEEARAESTKLEEKQIEDQGTEQDTPAVSLNDIYDDDHSKQNDDRQNSDNESPPNQIDSFFEQEEDSDIIPIWQRYADTEDENDNDSNNPNKPNITGGQNDLKSYLQNDEDYFVDELFNGSSTSYHKALEDISNRSYWNEAYQLIEKQIFNPNDINIYSKAAVDFTDRLQEYFYTKKK